MILSNHYIPNVRLYYQDEHNQRQGEFKNWWYNENILRIHGFFKDNKLHGEYISRTKDGNIYNHSLYIHGEEYPIPIDEITPEDKLLLSIKHDLRWCN